MFLPARRRAVGRSILPALTLCFYVLFGPPTAMAEPEPAAVDARVRALLDRLSDEDIAQRDAAQKDLQLLGRAAIAEVTAELAASKDAEVRFRCEQVLAAWERRWEDALKTALTAPELRGEIARATVREAAEADPEAVGFAAPEPLTIEAGAELLREPVRFYVLEVLERNRETRPRLAAMVAVRDTGVGTLVQCSGRSVNALDVLRPLLLPATTTEARARTAALIARVTQTCIRCNASKAPLFDPGTATATTAAEGRVSVQFPGAGTGEATDKRFAGQVVFDAAGVAESVDFPSARHGHK